MPRIVRKRDNSALINKYKHEKKVKVYGSPIYVPPCGDIYTFTFNGLTVSIKFDGTWQEYPETIAKMLIKKLDAIAVSNTPIKKLDQKIT